MAGRKSRFKISGSKLKELLLRLQINEDGRKISVREMARTTLMDYVYGDKKLSMGVVDYQFGRLAEYNPYPNEEITESLVYRYGKDNGLIPEGITEEMFTNNTQKIKHMVDDHTLMRACEMTIIGETLPDLLSLKTREETLRNIAGDDFDIIREIHRKKLENR